MAFYRRPYLSPRSRQLPTLGRVASGDNLKVSTGERVVGLGLYEFYVTEELAIRPVRRTSGESRRPKKRRPWAALRFLVKLSYFSDNLR